MDEGRGVWELADLVTPMSIRVAATLRVADHLAVGRSTAEIASIEHVDADALDRLLGHLVTAGVLRRVEGGGYASTPAGAELRSDHPAGLRNVLDIEGPLGRAELSLVELLRSVATGDAGFPMRYGRTFWEDLSDDAGRATAYAERMGEDVARWAPAIVAGFDWNSLGSIVDVGGGDGSLSLALLRAFPGLRATVLDMPTTAERARVNVAEAGLADRCDVVEGSFFEPLPAGADGYVLSAILHDWNDEDARAILARCADAAAGGGSILAIEKIGPDGESVRTAMDLRMLAYFGGRERGVAAIGALAADVGLGTRSVHPSGDLVIVELDVP
jgi:hypothetical protein